MTSRNGGKRGVCESGHVRAMTRWWFKLIDARYGGGKL